MTILYNDYFQNVFMGLVELKKVKWNEKDIFNNFVTYCFKNFSQSHSQIFQDFFVLYLTNAKNDGYFVEFGATNGIDLSNSYLLEKKFNWNGILAEPARSWHPDLFQNRGVHIDTRCVWKESGQTLEFNEVAVRELSTVHEYSNSDHYEEERKESTLYNVETISLNDLLATYQAPEVIDYMSIDTEGTEYLILEAFDFKKYNVSLFTIEHNYTPNRELIFQLMKDNNYIRIFDNISRWDDWYIRADLF